jgi:hypothetical protein
MLPPSVVCAPFNGLTIINIYQAATKMTTKQFYCKIFLPCFLVMCVSCVLTQPSLFIPYNFKHDIQSQKCHPKIDHLMIVLDASISMTTPYLGREKFQTAIIALHQLNTSLSAMNIPTGLRIIGTGSCHFCNHSKKLFSISPFDPSRLTINHLKNIHPGGESPMNETIMAVKSDFGHRTGHLGLIMISDWENDPLIINEAIQNICTYYSNRISICNVFVGDQEKIKIFSNQNSYSCVQWIPSRTLLSYHELKAFVQQFFLAPIYDEDQDGIKDPEDNCLNTPKGAWIDQKGCPIDSDSDGILDGLDLCPKTLEGASVDTNGCWKLPVLYYQNNQFYMTRAQEKKLNVLTNVLKKHKICIEIQGYADASGTDQKNYDISLRRAQSVMAFFLSKGLRSYQMEVKAFGAVKMDNKVSNENDTQRRVEFKVIKCSKEKNYK